MPRKTSHQNHEVMTATLHIEHEITEYATGKQAFDCFADVRDQQGVTARRIRLDEVNDRHIVIDLDFESTASAHAFARSCTTASGEPSTPPPW